MTRPTWWYEDGEGKRREMQCATTPDSSTSTQDISNKPKTRRNLKEKKENGRKTKLKN